MISKKEFELICLAMAALLRGSKKLSVREENCMRGLELLRNIYIRQGMRKRERRENNNAR